MQSYSLLNDRRHRGLPDDASRLRALVIDLHGRAQEQERLISLQRKRLRQLAHILEGVAKNACEPQLDLRSAGEQLEARTYSPVDQGRNGSGAPIRVPVGAKR